MASINSNLEPTFKRALELHQSGQLSEAKLLYQDVLEHLPTHAGCLHLLGLIAYQSEEFDEAIDLISRAIVQNPLEAKYFADRGIAYRKCKQFDLALQDYESALIIEPRFFLAHVYKGNLYKELRDFKNAALSFEAACSINSNDVQVQFSLANVEQALEQHDKALKRYDWVTKLAPNYGDAFINWGVSLRSVKQFDAAIQCFEKAVALNPQSHIALNNLGLTHHALRNYEKAIACYQKAIHVSPNYVSAHNNLGQAYLALGHPTQALNYFSRALGVQNTPEVLTNRANAWTALNDFDKAFEDLESAVCIEPNFNLAHVNRSMLNLLLGRFDKGWPEYEWRLKVSNTLSKAHLQGKQRWHGHEDIKGQTILLVREQGFGDTLQFCRYAQMLKLFGARVLLEVQKPLIELMKGLEGVDAVYSDGEVAENFDWFCPLMSLPLAFQTHQSTIPGPFAYLQSNEQRVSKWQKILGQAKSKRIGLVFSGSPTHLNDSNRSIALRQFIPYLPTGFEYICLQRDLNDQDTKQLQEAGIQFLGELIADFSDTAALIDLVDLVVSVDTSVAHLSGAMGKPTWILLPALPDWRWMLQSSDSPWYPSAKLYRQSNDRTWQPVLSKMAKDLRSTFESAPIQNIQATQMNSFEQGLLLHQKGQLNDAQQIYERVLSENPEHVEALHFSGVIAFQNHRLVQAVELIKKSIQLRPAYAEAHCHLGLSLQALNQLEEALESFNKAIAIQADFAQAHNNKGLLLQKLGQYELAIQCFDEATHIDPHFAGAYFNQGNALKNAGKLEQALEAYDKAIASEANYAEAFNNRGVVLKELQQLELAALSFEKAFQIKPEYAEAYNNCGNTLKALTRHQEAIAVFDKALSIRPHFSEAHNNKGFALHELGQYEKAIECFDQAILINKSFAEAYGNKGNSLKKLECYQEAVESYQCAIELKPNYAEAFYNMGVVLTELLKLKEAETCYNQAIQIDPSSPIVFRNRAMVLLMQGQFEQGWKDYEWRWEQPEMVPKKRRFSQPLWLGQESLNDKTILLYAEQGLGDNIQFCRYVKLVSNLGAKVVLQLPQSLHQLFESLDGVFEILESVDESTKFDFHCPLMSLPLAFNTRLETVPFSHAYLSIDKNLVNEWQQKLGPKTKPRIGLVWSGSTGHGNDRNRSLRLAQLLEKMPTHCDYISLQKECREVDQQALATSNVQYFGQELKNFAHTAALCHLMDIVISVDTSVAHLSAALGQKTWILLPYVPDWRWMIDTHKSPWYGSVKLYRQTADRQWDSVIDQVALELNSLQFNF